jgi:glutamate-1-semialdehyde 2,1-aminomutase
MSLIQSAPPQTYLASFIERYTRRTATSKQLTQQHRAILADPRVPEGFIPAIKELVYPIVGQRSQGSRLWDVDGNEYVDLTMGLGVNLFGHNPGFIHEAIAQQLSKGIQIGPQSELAGEVASLICELTGAERVAFSNSGTEAVMTAIRLARAVTGRTKIAMFAGSYHGHFDGTLVKSQIIEGQQQSISIAPGIPAALAQETLVLPYDRPEALELIRLHASELAAVLVVPVQTTRPNLQPQDFLHQLRQLTTECYIPLVFDEMITGFRIHPGGAQAWFGVQADLVTYGKIIGGGLPIGVIAGKAAYLDAIDGGFWQYGDDSSPQATTTFFAGTFSKHPLAMAAAQAVLQHLKAEGPSLQTELNQRTTQFVQALNQYFEADQVPLRMANFGSLFGPAVGDISDDDTGEDDAAVTLALLYYHLIERGVLPRGSGGYLSTAHTDADLEFILQAIRESVQALRGAQFLPPLTYAVR